MSLARQDLQGMAAAAGGKAPSAALQRRCLDRQRRRRQARWLSSLLLVMGLSFVGHQFAEQPEPNRMRQMADKLVPEAQAARAQAPAEGKQPTARR